MNKVYCGKSGDNNCATCKLWTGRGSGSVVCPEDNVQCKYKLSFINLIKAVFS
jgi:hypothetical protein